MTEEMANIVGTVISIPRRCERQTTRNNVEADTPEIYWQRLIFLPFLDHLLQECDTRFSAITGKAVLGLKLLPNNVDKLTYVNITDLQEYHCHDLPSQSSKPAEVRLWKKNAEHHSPGSPQCLNYCVTVTFSHLSG